MKDIIQTVVTVICAVLASSGFWAFLSKRSEKNDASKKMILGLGHDRIVSLGMSYIERGDISQSEYENLHKYLYEPYKQMGGNGSADRVMREVEKLKIVPDKYAF